MSSMITDKVTAVWKPQGWTPLQAVQAFKNQHPQYVNETVSYAGRLDPMAQGVLLLLIGDENKKRKHYEKLEKDYETEMVIGITTDSFDALGIVTGAYFRPVAENELRSVLPMFTGRQEQAYPAYSSKAVNGKPLYWWTRQKRLPEIRIPLHTIDIYSIDLTGIRTVPAKLLYSNAVQKIRNVSGDFRQKEILVSWKKFSETSGKETVTIAGLRVSCASGTYIRQLVSDIGDRLGCGAFALSITRTRVGDYMKQLCDQLT